MVSRILRISVLVVLASSNAWAGDAHILYSLFTNLIPAGFEGLNWAQELSGVYRIATNEEKTRGIVFDVGIRKADLALATQKVGKPYDGHTTSGHLGVGYGFLDLVGTAKDAVYFIGTFGMGRFYVENPSIPEASTAARTIGLDVFFLHPLSFTSDRAVFGLGISLEKPLLTSFDFDGRTFTTADFGGYLALRGTIGYSF